MINRISHVSVYVLDQDEAKAFYTEKLDFEVRVDVSNDGFRWLTVGPKGQSNLEIILMPIVAFGAVDENTAATIRDLTSKGAFGCGVLETDDCKATYEKLKKKGVEFKMPPAQRPYGIEAVLNDNSGNWFSLVQRTEG